MAFEAALKMDVSGFSSGVNQASQGVSKLATAVQGLAVAGIAIAAISKAADMVAASMRNMYSAMEAGGALVDLQEQTGIAIDKLMVMQTAFQQAGMGAEEVQPVINKMQKAIEAAATSGGPAAEAFNRIGLSASKLSAMTADQQLQAVGDAVARIENPTQRAATAMEIFGKSGGRALALFAAGGLDDAAKAVGNQARLMKENAGVFDRVTDILGTASTKMQGLFGGMASNIAPMLMDAVTAFNSIDLSGIGQQLGAAVAIVLEAFSEGRLGTLALESLKYAFTWAVNFMSSALSSIFGAALQGFIEGFKILTSADFWGGMLTSLVGIAQQFIATIATGISGILTQWAILPAIGEKAAKAAQAIGNYAKGASARGSENTTAGAAVLTPLVIDAGKAIADAAKAASAAAPQMEQMGALKTLATELATSAGAKVAKARAENAPKEIPAPSGELVQKVKPGGFDFVSSLTKIGGNMFGPSGGGNEAITLQRQQLEAQRAQQAKQEQTNILLKAIEGKMGSSGVVYG
jgi:hypothetical protein